MIQKLLRILQQFRSLLHDANRVALGSERLQPAPSLKRVLAPLMQQLHDCRGVHRRQCYCLTSSSGPQAHDGVICILACENGYLVTIGIDANRVWFQRIHGLKLMLQTVDIRLNLVERTRLVSRPVLARGIVRALNDHPWLTAQEKNFRRFMRTLNRDGGGVLYEALPEKAVDDLMRTAIQKAQATLAVAA